jgi:L-threonylcarbamoyladenylate synthase
MTQMETSVIWITHPLTDQQLIGAARALSGGRLVAFPTETVYGLGANALDQNAVAEIFRVKGRPADNPLIVHVAEPSDIERLVSGHSELAEVLLREFSPGPLTVVLPRSSEVSDLVTAGLDTVAVRIPAHPVARRLIKLAGVPVAAPSANRSGKPSPTRAWHVIDDLSGLIPYIIDDGPCEYGLESTVLDLTGDEPVILRPGAVTAEDILERTGVNVATGPAGESNGSGAPRSPGMKYRHYAPRADVLLLQGTDCNERGLNIRQLVSAPENGHKRIGLFSCGNTRIASGVEWQPLEDLTAANDWSASGLFYIDYSHDPDPAAAANKLFAALRRFDKAGIDIIIAETLPVSGVGRAYMNRLTKAAGGQGKIPEGSI